MNNELQHTYLLEALKEAKGLTVNSKYDSELAKLRTMKPGQHVIVPRMRAEKTWVTEIVTTDIQRTETSLENTGNLIHTGWTVVPEENVANAIMKLYPDTGVDGYIGDLKSIGFEFGKAESHKWKPEDRNVI